MPASFALLAGIALLAPALELRIEDWRRTLGVMAGPMVRSSYRAGRLWARAMEKSGRAIPEHLAHIEDTGSASQEASSLVQRLR